MVTVPTIEDFADTTVMGVIRKIVDYICNTIISAINTATGNASTALTTAQAAQTTATQAQTDVNNLEAYVGTDTDLIPSS